MADPAEGRSLSDRSEPAWTIAVDLSPGKVNGDYLLSDDQQSRRGWYESHPKAWALTEVTPTKRGMNTVRDVEETVLRCARAVGQADPDHTVEDFDVIGVVADMVEVYARENARLRERVASLEVYAIVAARSLKEAGLALPADEGQAS